MKTTGQDIPPELEQLFRALVSPGPETGTGQEVQRTRRKISAPDRRSKLRQLLLLLYENADFLARKLRMKRGSAGYNAFVYLEVRRLVSQIFLPENWLMLIRDGHAFYESVPVTEEDPAPRPYIYRTSDMLPTISLYEPGAPSTGPERIVGQVIGDYFRDGPMVWRTDTFVLEVPMTPEKPAPLLASFVGDIQVNATERGSRPMFSMIFRAELYEDSGLNPFQNIPPGTSDISFYWRYAPPEGPPPYYSQSLRRAVTIDARHGADAEPEAVHNFCDIKRVPRPMFGYGQNNNLSVVAEMSGTTNLYQINPCIGQQPQCLTLQGANQVRSINMATGAVEAAPVTSGSWVYAWNTPRAMRCANGQAPILCNQLGQPLKSLAGAVPVASFDFKIGPHPEGFLYWPRVLTSVPMNLITFAGDVRSYSMIEPSQYPPGWYDPPPIFGNGPDAPVALYPQSFGFPNRVIHGVVKPPGSTNYQVGSFPAIGNATRWVSTKAGAWFISSDGEVSFWKWQTIPANYGFLFPWPPAVLVYQTPVPIRAACPHPAGLYILFETGAALVLGENGSTRQMPPVNTPTSPSINPGPFAGVHTGFASCYNSLWAR